MRHNLREFGTVLRGQDVRPFGCHKRTNERSFLAEQRRLLTADDGVIGRAVALVDREPDARCAAIYRLEQARKLLKQAGAELHPGPRST